MNFEELGLKVGLEVHQQLATKHKLFCNCTPRLSKDFDVEVVRRLRPTQSELGEIDPAALFEFKKGMYFKYLASEESSCLVELDEEPPHGLNPEAVEIALLIAMCLNSRPVDEIHTMRKLVIDGSNTTGFQRTAIVALGGELRYPGGKVGVQTVCLEEDAARLVEKGEGYRAYALDRLGIPLVEVALEPVTAGPKEVQEIAVSLGRLLRATGRVARGLGTIRQDINVSIRGGGVVEVKGVQRLELISKIIEYEAKRQHGLMKLKELIEERGLERDAVGEPVDLTEIFSNTSCKVLKKAVLFRIERRGEVGVDADVDAEDLVAAVGDGGAEALLVLVIPAPRCEAVVGAAEGMGCALPLLWIFPAAFAIVGIWSLVL